jgi:hypothetical protein
MEAEQVFIAGPVLADKLKRKTQRGQQTHTANDNPKRFELYYTTMTAPNVHCGPEAHIMKTNKCGNLPCDLTC